MISPQIFIFQSLHNSTVVMPMLILGTWATCGGINIKSPNVVAMGRLA